jgi:hypothetical protein
MIKKIFLALILVSALIATSGSAVGFHRPNQPSWENVFTPPVSDFTVVWSVESFKNNLYAAVANYPSGMQLYRSANGKDWSAVGEGGFGLGSSYLCSWDMTVFEGSLYVSVHDLGVREPDFVNVPGRIMRSRNGLDWETVFVVNDEDFLSGHLPAAFGTFNGMLYVASSSDVSPSDSQIWRSKNGNPGSWEKVLTVDDAFFGAPLTAFKGYAYVSGVTGLAQNILTVWRSRDGLTWETVGAGVLDDSANTRDGSLAEFKGDLYLSTQSAGGGRIYRSKDGKNWSPVVSDGFGDPSLIEINGLIVYEGDLYATGTAYGEDGTPYARVYRSHTGKDWEQIPTDSWGPNSGNERMQQAIFKGSLYLSNFNFNSTSSVFKMVKH